MARPLRIVLPGLPHHLTHRGNDRQTVFFHPDDRGVFLHLLKDACTAHGVGLCGYCLMTNHAHLVPRPSHQRALAILCQEVFGPYAQMINRREHRTGHL
jgi:putative transposase